MSSDSQLVVNQIMGTYQARGSRMASYLSLAKELQSYFKEFKIKQLSREDNSHADALAALGAATQTTIPKVIPIVYLQWPAVWKGEHEAISNVTESSSWMTPIIQYL